MNHRSTTMDKSKIPQHKRMAMGMPVNGKSVPKAPAKAPAKK